MPSDSSTTPAAGQVWRSKRDPWRRVTIVEINAGWVHVERNTSRRRQPVKVTTLLRDYELHSAPS